MWCLLPELWWNKVAKTTNITKFDRLFIAVLAKHKATFRKINTSKIYWLFSFVTERCISVQYDLQCGVYSRRILMSLYSHSTNLPDRLTRAQNSSQLYFRSMFEYKRNAGNISWSIRTYDTVTYKSTSSMNESLLRVYIRSTIILLLADNIELIRTDKM